MKIQAITTPKIAFKNNSEFLKQIRSQYVYDAKAHAPVLKEFFEHPDLADKSGKAEKVIENLMDRTCMKVTVSCLEAIDTLRAIKYKHPHLEKYADGCINLLEYYNEYKTW